MAEPVKDGAVIGEDAHFAGRFLGQDLLLLGRLEGEIQLRGRLRLGPKAQARSNVRAATVEVEGELEGEIRADMLSLAATARVRGTLIVKRLAVQEGAVLEGAVNPGGAKEAAGIAAPVVTAPVPVAPSLSPAAPFAPPAAPVPGGVVKPPNESV